MPRDVRAEWAAIAPDWAEFCDDLPPTVKLTTHGRRYELRALLVEMRIDPPQIERHNATTRSGDGSEWVEGLLKPPVYHLTLVPIDYGKGSQRKAALHKPRRRCSRALRSFPPQYSMEFPLRRSVVKTCCSCFA